MYEEYLFENILYDILGLMVSWIIKYNNNILSIKINQNSINILLCTMNFSILLPIKKFNLCQIKCILFTFQTNMQLH